MTEPIDTADNAGRGRTLLERIRFIAENLGPLIVFLVLEYVFDFRVAIAVGVAVIFLDVIRRLWLHIAFTRLYLASCILPVCFATVSLISNTAEMFKFEAVFSNLAVCGAFIIGARGKTSIIQEVVEHQRGAPIENRPDLHRFFAYFTLFWGAYFLIKSVIYLWIALVLPLENLIKVRTVFGYLSLLIMIWISMTQGHRLYGLCQRLGILPPKPE